MTHQRRPLHVFERIVLAYFGLVLLGVLAMALSGCAQDLITRAEQTERLSDSAITILWQFDDENRDLMRTEFPAAHAFVESLRRKGPDGVRNYDRQWRSLDSAITVFEATGTVEDQSTLKGAADAVASIADQARAYLITVQAAHPDKVSAVKAKASTIKVKHG